MSRAARQRIDRLRAGHLYFGERCRDCRPLAAPLCLRM